MYRYLIVVQRIDICYILYGTRRSVSVLISSLLRTLSKVTGSIQQHSGTSCNI